MVQLFLSKFKVWQRMLILLMTFFIPLGVLGLYSLSGIQSHIDFARKEQLGVKLTSDLNKIYTPLSQLTVKNIQPNELEKNKETIFNILDSLESDIEQNKSYIKLDQVSAAIIGLRRSLDRLSVSNASDYSAQLLVVLGEIHSIGRQISSSSNMILDPDLDSYTIFDTLVYQIPEIHDALIRLYYNQENETDNIDSIRWEGILSLHLMPNVASNAEVIIKEDRNFYGESESLQKYLTEISASLNNFNNRVSIPEVISQRFNIHQLYSGISARLAGEVNILLENRIKSYKGIRAKAWCYTILALALLPIFSVVLVRSITRPINTLINATKRAAQEGDLSLRVEVIGKDEISELASSFNIMVDALDSMVKRVHGSGLMVTSSAKEIAAVSKQQQATSAEVAATTLEIEATSKEISATTKHLSKTMQEVHEVAEGTATLAGEGQEGLTKMRETMQSIMAASSAISSKLSVLNERAIKINSVITTITKVADQTNLLSLNAAIEAEKAGEFGQGFAVVAREIRRLADQTAVATFDIEQMVKEMQSSVSTGVMGMERFADEVKRGVNEVESVSAQLREIIEQVQTLTPRFDSVSEGMQSQVLGAQQISEGLGQLSTAVQQTADSLRQSNQSIERLNEAAGGLKQGVEKFKLSQDR